MANFKSMLFIFGRSDLGRALAVSLALHALLLLQTLPGASSRWQQHAMPAGNALDATLHGMSAPLAALPALPAKSPGTTDSILRRRQVPPPLQPARVSAPGMPSGRETLSSAGSATVTPPSSEDGLDADGLRQYRLSLAVASRRFKHYPPQALELAWSGTAEVRIAIAASGVPQPVQLLSSSGHELLDAAALEMIGKAALHTTVPASLRGRTFSVPLPVVFDLAAE